MSGDLISSLHVHWVQKSLPADVTWYILEEEHLRCLPAETKNFCHKCPEIQNVRELLENHVHI